MFSFNRKDNGRQRHVYQIFSRCNDSIDNQLYLKLNQLGEEIHEQVMEGISFPELLAYVPWGHHVEILKKCQSVNEALFYICRTMEEGWS